MLIEVEDTKPSVRDVGRVCRALTDELLASGYAELTSSLAPFYCAAPRMLAHARQEIAAPVDLLSSVFFFGESVERAALDRALGRTLVSELVESGLMRPSEAGGVATSGLTLRSVLGLWYFHENPTPDPNLYFGEDSVALAWRQPYLRSGRVLDLCSGPGFQLLHAVRHGANGIGVEINRFAADVARINAAMNELSDRTEFRVGNLYGMVRPSERFDYVVCNPPFIPFPGEQRYPFAAHGGDDGLEITRIILDGLPNVLAPGGSAQIIGAAFSDGLRLSIEGSLETWARATGMDVIVSITSHVPVMPGTEGFTCFTGVGLAKDAESQSELERRFTELARSHGGHIAGFFLLIRHGQGRVLVQDVAAQRRCGLFWM